MRVVPETGADGRNIERIQPGHAPSAGKVMALFGKLEGVPSVPKKHGNWVYSENAKTPTPLPYWNDGVFPLLFPMLLPYHENFYRCGIPVCETEFLRSKKVEDN
uniref:Uncharacterized protein n=1 Tax=Ascaris lumbricoides TaxID=6252 RepID=A0A0M3IE18_ASCLU